MKNGDPQRWLDDPASAPRGALPLLRAAPRPSRPPPELRTRLGSELRGLAATAPPHPLAWPLATGCAVVALGVAGWLGMPHLRPPAAVPLPSPAAVAAPPRSAAAASVPPARAAAPAEPAPAIVTPPPSADRPRATTAPARIATLHHVVTHAAPRTEAAPAAAAPPRADSLAREAALIEEARRTVRANPGGALQTLERHRREFPQGQLIAEREFLAVHALVSLGRRDEAGARGRRLMQQYPGSAYAQQVPALLARGAGAAQ